MQEVVTISAEQFERLKKRMGLRFYLDEIKAMRQAGATYQEIATKYKVSYQRIHQLLTEAE